MIMLDSEVDHPAAAKPPPAAAAAASEGRSPSAAGAGDDVDEDDQHLLITDVVKALIMYAQVSGDGHNQLTVSPSNNVMMCFVWLHLRAWSSLCLGRLYEYLMVSNG
jgi:hypothetical protein